MGIDFTISKSLEKMPNASEIVLPGQGAKGPVGGELYSSVGTARKFNLKGQTTIFIHT